MDFADKLAEALESRVAIATILQHIQAAEVAEGGQVLQPHQGQFRTFAPGHSVAILKRADTQGDHGGGIRENVWISPIGGGKVYLAGVPSYDEFFKTLSWMPVFSLPTQLQAAHRRLGRS
jgi:hypothetical protein